MLDDSITEIKIEDRFEQSDKDSGEPELYCDNVQLNIDRQSYEEKSITDEGDNVTKTLTRRLQRHVKYLNKQKT